MRLSYGASFPSPCVVNVANNFFVVFWQTFFINSTRFSAICKVSERASVLPDLKIKTLYENVFEYRKPLKLKHNMPGKCLVSKLLNFKKLPLHLLCIKLFKL